MRALRLLRSLSSAPVSGRDAEETGASEMTTTTAVSMDTARVIDEFNDALNRHDVDAVMALMTEDCVFENTSPGPDGERFVGQRAIRAFWVQMLANSPLARFDAEEIIVCADRCTVQWRYSWGEGHIRGIDLFRVRDGKVAEKFAYVKG